METFYEHLGISKKCNQCPGRVFFKYFLGSQEIHWKNIYWKPSQRPNNENMQILHCSWQVSQLSETQILPQPQLHEDRWLVLLLHNLVLLCWLQNPGGGCKKTNRYDLTNHSKIVSFLTILCTSFICIKPARWEDSFVSKDLLTIPTYQSDIKAVTARPHFVQKTSSLLLDSMAGRSDCDQLLLHLLS